MIPKIITTSPTKPPRMIIYGENKIGKSSFGASMPFPIFIQTEDGLDNLGVKAFERAASFDDILSQLEYLISTEHNYKTLVLDSLDWTEKVIWEGICKAKGWNQIGDGAYGEGYKLAMNQWRELIKYLDILNTKKKMLICLIAHAKVTKFEDPERENYDRYTLDLNEKSGNLLCEYVDIIGFCGYKIIATEKKDGFSVSTKAKSTGERVLNLNDKASYKAGNRYGLPDKIALSWEALATELKAKLKRKKDGNPNDEDASKELEKGDRGKVATGNLGGVEDAHQEAKKKRALQSKEEPIGYKENGSETINS